MTTLRLIREPTVDGATLGVLFVDGVFQCFTLEDPIREQLGVPVEVWKRPGETAIPAGCYEVTVTWSPRFQRNLPELRAVPGFSGIRIHTGNRSADTAGCILVGFQRAHAVIQQSRPAFAAIMAACEAGPTRLIIENPQLTISS
jgi:hypothetical protein